MNDIPVLLIITILLAHWVSDFILQNRWMADNKGKQFIPLLIHVCVYTVGLFCLILIYSHNYLLASEYALINGIVHFITDKFSSKATSYYYAKKDFYGFFAIVGLDQMFHFLALFLTAGAMLT